jgi:hypothetical protein
MPSNYHEISKYNEEQLGKDRRSRSSQVAMYADSAHFIFEILQNSDDAGATEVTFDLSSERLIIEHNGKIFNERDVKAISYFGQGKGSRKDEQEITPIGRFGLGFKSVFSYTASPHIYSGDESFKITNLYTLEAVPRLNDLSHNRTRIILPFDHESTAPVYIERHKQRDEARNEISRKLIEIECETLLFTRNLKQINWVVSSGENSQKGYYQREDTLVAECAREITISTDSKNKTHFLVFDQPLESHSSNVRGRLVQLAYRLSDRLEDGGVIKDVAQSKLFVFFKTEKDTHASLIIQGPYRTTPARDNIPEQDEFNKFLVEETALLLKKSLSFLQEKKLLSFGALCTLPLDYHKFPSGSFFYPLYNAAREALETKPILPTSSGCFVSAKNSKIAYRDEILEIIDNNQLSQLFNREINWLSKGIKSYDLLYKTLTGVRRIPQYNYQPVEWVWPPLVPGMEVSADELARKMDITFFESQQMSWLKKFVQFLFRNPPQSFFDLPFVRLSSGKHVRPREGGKQQVYLRMEENFNGAVDLPILNAELSEDPEIVKFLVEKFRIGPPVLVDLVLKTILPKYTATTNHIDPSWKQDFHLIVTAFIKTDSVEKRNELLASFRNAPHLLGSASGTLKLVKPSQLHFYSRDVESYFRGNAIYSIVPPDIYDDKALEYLSEIGVRKTPMMHYPPLKSGDVKLESCHGHHLKGLNGFDPRWEVDGLEWALSQNTSTVELSLFIWNLVLEHSKGIRGTTRFSTRANFTDCKDTIVLSKTGEVLTKYAWLPNSQCKFFKPSEISFTELADEFKDNQAAAQVLSEQLGMKNSLEKEAINLISKGNSRIKNIAEYLINASDDALIEFEKFISNSKRFDSKRDAPGAERSASDAPSHVEETSILANITRNVSELKASRRPQAGQSSLNSPAASHPRLTESTADDEPDDDVLVPVPINYANKIQNAELRYASEIADLERSQNLMTEATKFDDYTYGWFLALLELECLASAEKNWHGGKILIRFGKVTFKDDGTILLSQPDRHVPQAIEEYSNVPLELRTATGDKRIEIASFSAKEFLLLGRLKAGSILPELTGENVLEGRISIENPSFLLDAAWQRFKELGDRLPTQGKMEFNLKKNLTEKINFVFGPPGTGKTTYLARNILIPRLGESERVKILVLTPTNKAADVLIERIISAMDGQQSFKDWLVRFGSASERVVSEGILKDRDFDINAQSRSVVVTTIARFAYDGFSSSMLRDIEWDYIVIDEASMIPIASIIYPFYQCPAAKFVIAGDPFQIEPIVSVDLWKGKNIYTLVGLNDFGIPATQPHAYKVEKLLTQYRSVPAIGAIFSAFSYGRLLKHDRKNSDRINLESIDGISPLTIIKFPVSKYESIYRSKRLNGGTSYQIYSAVFTFEFACWLRREIKKVHNSRVRIGVVAPYRAQADIVCKLVDSLAEDAGNVKIHVGSIHGFQGDECEIIIAVLNPPPNLSKNDQMFLNNKNILNVAISRARDYLVLVVPDEETEDYDKLKKLKEIKELFKADEENYTERTAQFYESLIFKSSAFLEQNVFSTGHQMVNVYRRPELRYEVRCDNFAVDVQFHSEALLESPKSLAGEDFIGGTRAAESGQGEPHIRITTPENA